VGQFQGLKPYFLFSGLCGPAKAVPLLQDLMIRPRLRYTVCHDGAPRRSPPPPGLIESTAID
jgi:hypothetical protein